MRAWLVVLAACGPSRASPEVPPAKPVEPTGPALWVAAPGATALAVLNGDVYWFAPVDGGSDVDTDANGIFVHRDGVGYYAPRFAHVAVGARGFAAADRGLTWGEGSAVQMMMVTPPPSGPVVDGDGREIARVGIYGAPHEIAHVADGTVASVAARRGRLAIGADTSTGAMLVRIALGGGAAHADPLDGADPVVLAGGDAFDVGTSTTLYRVDGDAAPDGVPVAGGVRALAADGDDVFAGGTTIYERAGRGRLVKLGPAGGPVTAMAVDAAYVYWAIAAGDRDPAIYRALRKKPELELLTKIGAANALAVAGAYLYWCDPSDGAIHRIRR